MDFIIDFAGQAGCVERLSQRPMLANLAINFRL
jgi:hypothetical protein